MIKSIGFPDMVSSTSTNILEDHEATSSNLKLMLLSDKCSLLGDPYFGTNLKRLTFEQNNKIIKDLVIDNIYSSIITFMPQLSLTRKDIEVTSDKEKIHITIRATNRLDFTTNLYTINLMSDEEI